MKNWNLTGFGHISPSPQWQRKSHHHDISELIVILEGILHVKEPDGTIHKGMSGDIFIYPAGCWHEEESDKDNPVETIFFGFAGATCERIKSLHDFNGRIRSLSQWIHSSRQNTDDHSQTINQAFFHAIQEEFMRLENLPLMNAAVSGVRTFVHENIARKITLEDLASTANMSKFHFLREYKKQTGQLPMAYVRSVRIEKAKNLIACTNLPLKAIAVMVGFSNEYQLSSIIKKFTGHTPSYFREENTDRRYTLKV